MATFYRSVDIFVLSSRTEGFRNAVGEVMGHGLPVVATDVGDVALLVGPSGIVVPPDDPHALAAAIESIMELSPESHAALVRSSRERTETRFVISAVAAESGASSTLRKPVPQHGMARP